MKLLPLPHLPRCAAALACLAFAPIASGGEVSPASPSLPYTPGPFAPSWESLQAYRCPEWFRDAKFGIWAHWGPQSQAEAGDWYGRNLYVPGHKQNAHHLATYGHPSEFGFKDLCHAWKAENFDPKRLLAAYRAAGARYFVAMANHHDNFDLWNSRYQPWNSVNIGPRRDLIGEWAAATAAEGLRFGVSIHASSAWTWFEVAQRADESGPLAGVPYDGNLTLADGQGKWWEGFDPQDLYAQYGHRISPDVLDRRKAYFNPGDPPTRAYLEKYYNRVRDLTSTYAPDLVYFDDSRLPLNDIDPAYGLHIAADLYNSSLARHGGRNEAVMNAKRLDEMQKRALVHDFEVGVARDILPEPWQVDACIGHWHYLKGARYRSAERVIRALVDVVSKNGNLLLSIPLRADGTLDEPATRILGEIGAWLELNGEAIYGTRPWLRFGEGPSTTEDVPEIAKGGLPLFRRAPYVAEDIRFTTRGSTLYVILLDWPASGRASVKSLAADAPGLGGGIARITLLGRAEAVAFTRTAEGLVVDLPSSPPGTYAHVLKIEGLAW